MKRILFVVLMVDAVIVAAGVTAYLLILRPQVAAIEDARDQAVRANVAMTARVHAASGRLALASGDSTGAQRAAADLLVSMDGLVARSPEGRERAEVMGVREQVMLVQTEIASDPAAARLGFGQVDSSLAALYPVATK